MHLSAVLLLIAGGPAVAEPLEPPVIPAEIRVRQEAHGRCADLDAGIRGMAPLLRLREVCHGWSTQSCADQLLVKTQGVQQDGASLLFLATNRSLNVAERIDREIGRRWPGRELFQLALTRVECQTGLVIAFEGSHVSTHGGPARLIAGRLTARSPAAVTIDLVSRGRRSPVP